MQLVLTPELLLHAYRHGLFPMAYSADSPYVHWFCPERRGQLSIEGLHIPRRLRQTVKRGPFEVRIDTAFEAVIRACGAATPERPETWINPAIIEAYCALHAMGHAHSVECWKDGVLVGGVYGLKIGAAFFGESMFSRATDASKVALVHLAARLHRGGFQILDTQFVNDHLQQFGVYELSHEDYMACLTPALEAQAEFTLVGMGEADLIKAYLSK